ncbi:hypothetical protein, partial [Burkholderia glumae]|uniref:hypothetical protein n=1 Tax=Burkholderia glumae TaxID=337 RepID=UPI0019D6E49F
MLASTVSMNNAQATISGAMKGWTTGGMAIDARQRRHYCIDPAPASARPPPPVAWTNGQAPWANRALFPAEARDGWRHRVPEPARSLRQPRRA